MVEVKDILKTVTRLENRVIHFKKEQNQYEQQLLERDLIIQKKITAIDRLTKKLKALETSLELEKSHLKLTESQCNQQINELKRILKVTNDQCGILQVRVLAVEDELKLKEMEIYELKCINQIPLTDTITLNTEPFKIDRRFCKINDLNEAEYIEDVFSVNNNSGDERENLNDSNYQSLSEVLPSTTLTLAHEIFSSQIEEYRILIKRLELQNQILTNQNCRLLKQAPLIKRSISHGYVITSNKVKNYHILGACNDDIALSYGLMKSHFQINYTEDRIKRKGVLNNWFSQPRNHQLNELDVLIFDRHNKQFYYTFFTSLHDWDQINKID